MISNNFKFPLPLLSTPNLQLHIIAHSPSLSLRQRGFNRVFGHGVVNRNKFRRRGYETFANEHFFEGIRNILCYYQKRGYETFSQGQGDRTKYFGISNRRVRNTHSYNKEKILQRGMQVKKLTALYYIYILGLFLICLVCVYIFYSINFSSFL